MQVLLAMDTLHSVLLYLRKMRPPCVIQIIPRLEYSYQSLN